MDCTISCAESAVLYGSCERNAESNHAAASSSSAGAKHRLRKSERKLLRHALKISRMRSLRSKRKTERKLRLGIASAASFSTSTPPHSVDGLTEETLDNPTRLSKQDKLRQVKERLRSALENGQRICIDMGMEKLMSAKECGRLAQQLGRLYGSHRKAEHPCHLYLTSINRSGFLFQNCVRKNCGFESYLVDFVEESVFDHFDRNSLVYLSPDADEVLRTIEADRVYVIGGLVDETRQKNVTLNQAKEFGVRTARLPIEEYCSRSDVGSFCQVLSVNQVFEILLSVSASGGDWAAAFERCLPKRLGFLPTKTELQVNDN